MKRVLIVSPHFPPVNAADCHRVRMYLPYFRDHGWEAEVLAVEPRFVEAPLDDLLLAGLPPDLTIHRTRAWPVGLTGRIGMRTIGRRCFSFIKSAGDRLLKTGRFDLAFFSTTAFSVFRLGPRWRRRFGVPFVIDLQDPWINPYYERHPSVTPPGGRVRYFLASHMARRWEPVVARAAAGIVTVSPAYKADWIDRYRLAAERFAVLPFGGSRADFRTLREANVQQSAYRPAGGGIDLVYVGRGGPDLVASFQALLQAFAEYRNEEPETAARFRFHFIGTSYADDARVEPAIEPIAGAVGVADQVRESPRRIPYFEALKCLADATALLAPTSVDAGYNPSKIANYLLSGKPLLVVEAQSSIVGRESTTRRGVTVAAGGDTEAIKRWFSAVAAGTLEAPAQQADELDARALSAELCRFFDRQLATEPGSVQ